MGSLVVQPDHAMPRPPVQLRLEKWQGCIGLFSVQLKCMRHTDYEADQCPGPRSVVMRSYGCLRERSCQLGYEQWTTRYTRRRR